MKIFVTLALLSVLAVPVVAKDTGPPPAVDAVRAVVQNEFGQVSNVTVSNHWALCLSNHGDNDVSVLLHRTGAHWKVIAHDGGAYDADALRRCGVPQEDVQPLLGAYQ